MMMLAGLVSWTRRGQRGSVSLHLRRSPQNCPAPLEWKPSIFSSSLFSVACRMHNPRLNKARTATLRVMWSERGGQRHVYSCVWDGGIAAHLIGALSTRASPNRYLLPLPPPPHPLHNSFTLSVHGCNIHNSDGGVWGGVWGGGWVGDVFGLRTTCWLLLAN